MKQSGQDLSFRASAVNTMVLLTIHGHCLMFKNALPISPKEMLRSCHAGVISASVSGDSLFGSSSKYSFDLFLYFPTVVWMIPFLSLTGFAGEVYFPDSFHVPLYSSSMFHVSSSTFRILCSLPRRLTSLRFSVYSPPSLVVSDLVRAIY